MITFCIFGVALFFTVFFYTVMKYQRVEEVATTA